MVLIAVQACLHGLVQPPKEEAWTVRVERRPGRHRGLRRVHLGVELTYRFGRVGVNDGRRVGRVLRHDLKLDAHLAPPTTASFVRVKGEDLRARTRAVADTRAAVGTRAVVGVIGKTHRICILICVVVVIHVGCARFHGDH